MFLLCMTVAACAPKVGADGGVYRNTAAPIYSNAVFDEGKLEGRWDQVAAFAAGPENGCRPGGAEFARKGGVMQVTYRLCLSGREVAGAGPISTSGPGRFGIGGKDGIGQDWWVLWVDEGYRTLAIGNPSGTFGFILNRGKSMPADRLTAAEEVFDFNGYDTGKLGGFGAQR